MNTTNNPSLNKAEILSLDSLQDAARAALCQSRIFWTSEKNPQAAAGVLVEDFEGAWLEPMKIVVRINGRQIEHTLPIDLAAKAPALLKPVLTAHLRGDAPNRIQSELDTAALTETHI